MEIPDGGASVEVGVMVGVSVGIGVFVGVGVIVGPNACPGLQAEIAKPIDNKTATGIRIDWILCFVFIFSSALSRAHARRRLKSEPQNF